MKFKLNPLPFIFYFLLCFFSESYADVFYGRKRIDDISSNEEAFEIREKSPSNPCLEVSQNKQI